MHIQVDLTFKLHFQQDITARENGYVGGYMTKKLVEMAEQQMAGKQQ